MAVCKQERGPICQGSPQEERHDWGWVAGRGVQEGSRGEEASQAGCQEAEAPHPAPPTPPAEAIAAAAAVAAAAGPGWLRPVGEAGPGRGPAGEGIRGAELTVPPGPKSRAVSGLQAAAPGPGGHRGNLGGLQGGGTVRMGAWVSPAPPLQWEGASLGQRLRRAGALTLTHSPGAGNRSRGAGPPSWPCKGCSGADGAAAERREARPGPGGLGAWLGVRWAWPGGSGRGPGERTQRESPSRLSAGSGRGYHEWAWSKRA